MAKLTSGDWLEAYKLVGFERHSEFPFLSVPEEWEYHTHSTCRTCPQVGKVKHNSYECGRMTAQSPVESTPNLWAFTTLQYLPSRISGDLFYPYGAVSGFSYTGFSSLSFAGRYTYEVTAASGNVLTCISSGDFGAEAIATQVRSNWGAPGRTFLNNYGYGIQPNDRAEPSSDSLAGGMAISRVVKVEYTRPGTCVVTVDQDLSGVMIDNREDQTEPFIPTITFIRHAAEPEIWTPVIWPSELNCHRNFVSFLAADFPEDFLFNLKRLDGTEGRIAEPDPVEGKGAVFTVWKKQLNPEPTEEVPEPEPSPIEDITAACLGRVKMIPVGPGPDFRGAYKTILCLGEKNWNGSVDFSPLIDENTEWVRILYYPEVNDNYTGSGHCTPCGRRCVNSVRDLSGSFYDADEGEAHLPNGEEWFCRIARTYTDEEDSSAENFGKWKRTWHKPSGIALYTADCSLRGLCDGYTNISRTTVIGDKPFTLNGGDANQILKEVTIGQDIALAQYWPGYPIFYVKRAGRPSIHSLTTAVPTNNPTDWSPNIFWVQGGLLVGNFDTGPHPSEAGTILNPLYGGAWDGRTLWSTLTFPAMPPGGTFPTNITGWTTGKIDALRRAYDDTTDPYKALRFYEDDCGVRAGRLLDDANPFGRGVSQAVRKIGAPEKFLLEKLDVGGGSVGADQERIETTFKFFDSEQVGPYGFPYWFTITFKNLLPEGGEPKGVIKEAKIINVDTSVAGQLTFHMENQSRDYSKLKNVGMGNSFNEVYTLKAGGGIVRPPDPLQIRSSETDDNSFGGIQDWASIGDSVTIEHNATGFNDFNKFHFCITAAAAYNGDKADDFGSGSRILVSDLSNGYYQIPEDNLDLGNGSRGRAIASEEVTAADYLSTDTTLAVAGVPPFCVWQWLKVETTNEIIQVLSVDVENRQLFVSRGTHGTTAQDIPEGKKLTLIKVFEPATDTILTEKTGDTKPSLATGEYWYDEQAARFYWAGVDAGKFFDIGYYVDDGSGVITQSRAYIEQTHKAFYLTIDGVDFAYPVFITDISDLVKWIGTGTGVSPETKVFLEGGEVGITGTNPPPSDKYFLYQDAGVNSGNFILIFAREHSGKGARINVANDAGETNPFNMDIADVPEFATGQAWGRKMDTITIADEKDYAAGEAASLIGKTLKVHRHEMIMAPDTELTALNYTTWQEDDYTPVSLSDVLLLNGLATLYGKQAPLDAMKNLYGPEPEPEEGEETPEPIKRYVCVEIE